ncbi:MAG: helix-turn-helix transcriptional regulator [Clostridia bacterium]|nr:helix-turn-helix transcriptional regulator [Clostridia bacterium]
MICHFDELEFKPVSVANFVQENGSILVKERPYASFSFRTKGVGEFEICGRHFTVKEGDLLFVPANVPYRVEYLSSEIIVAHLENCNYAEAECICLQNAVAVESLFRKLLEAWNGKHSVNHAKSILYEIMETIAEDKTGAVGDTAFADCVAYINAHFCDPQLDVEEICEHEFISVSSLQRKFRRYFEQSPKQYLIKLRMNRALELLIADRLSVREIALSCGFTSEKYFSRAFKAQYGCPPSQIKRHFFI